MKKRKVKKCGCAYGSRCGCKADKPSKGGYR